MKKFDKNDVFYNTISATPSYKVLFYNGNVTINDQLNERNKISSSIGLFETASIFTASFNENFSKANYFYSGSFNIIGTSSYNPVIMRNYIHKGGFTAFDEKYTQYSTVKKIHALKNIFTKYYLDNNSSIITTFLNDINLLTPGSNVGYKPSTDPDCFIKPKTSINLIEIPSAYYGIKVQPGSLNLKVYITGTLIAEACDLYKNTKIIQTSSSYDSSLIGKEVGIILYDEGILLLTASSALASTIEYYVQPVSSSLYNTNYTNIAKTDSPAWIHFGSNKVTTTNVGTNIPITSASFELNFKGSTERNTLTMFCTADKNDLTWSNNRTYLSGGQVNKLILGETSSINVNGTDYNAPSSSFFVPSNGKYFENDQVIIKNTLSSSYSNFVPTYKPQVFVSEIGIYNEEGDLIAIGKLANPLRKTPELDYTIKLKLDI